MMPKVSIKLAPALFDELKAAARAASDGEAGYRPEMFAQECVEVILAGRRLRRMPPAPYGGRPLGGGAGPEVEPCRVLDPEWSK
jgi:hypothetical protein